MKYIEKHQEEIFQLIFIIVPIVFLLAAISFNSVFSLPIQWLFVLINNTELSILVYFLFISFALTLMLFYRSKRNNIEFLIEKNVSFYKKLIVSISFIVLFSMLISTIFSSSTYPIIEFFNVIIACITVYLIVYIPSLFVEMIEGHHFLSFLYLLITHFVIQLILFIPIYIAYFIPGV